LRHLILPVCLAKAGTALTILLVNKVNRLKPMMDIKRKKPDLSPGRGLVIILLFLCFRELKKH
jgi:hypothetical protein